jgi:MscS family membrane protein
LIRPLAACVLVAGAYAVVVDAQKIPGAPAAEAAPERAAATDALGRTTPRGTVMGFLAAARRGENALAAEYLNDRGNQQRGERLAHDLFVVLDARMPARLGRISDDPEGSRANPLLPDQEIVASVEGSTGKVDIVLERVRRRESDPIWLVSGTTLAAVPGLYAEVVSSRQHALLPAFLTTTRFGGLRTVEWLAVLIGLPAVYLATMLLNRLLTPLIRLVFRRRVRQPETVMRNVLPVPARLLLVALMGGWALSALPLSLSLRQLLSNVASLVMIGSIVWLLILLNGEVERHIHRRIPRPTAAAGAALLRLLRRGVDLLLIFGGLIATLRHFGVDPTPALAGLGVGGIAVALAAQKTLENVIAGASLIFDQAVRVGDFLKMGDVLGTVDHIGLRSTRIRTLDRTIVSVPNGQIANVTLETLSARDKFWFHPIVPLRLETTPDQLHAVIGDIKQLLDQHPLVDLESVRVRFFRLGAFSLDVEVFAYLFARDWNDYLAIQEQLLFSVTEMVSRSGAAVALPSQRMYFADAPAAMTDPRAVPLR